MLTAGIRALRYPFVTCDEHPGEYRPGYLMCDHVWAPESVAVFIRATDMTMGKILCRECYLHDALPDRLLCAGSVAEAGLMPQDPNPIQQIHMDIDRLRRQLAPRFGLFTLRRWYWNFYLWRSGRQQEKRRKRLRAAIEQKQNDKAATDRWNTIW